MNICVPGHFARKKYPPSPRAGSLFSGKILMPEAAHPGLFSIESLLRWPPRAAIVRLCAS